MLRGRGPPLVASCRSSTWHDESLVTRPRGSVLSRVFVGLKTHGNSPALNHGAHALRRHKSEQEPLPHVHRLSSCTHMHRRIARAHRSHDPEL